MILYLSKIFYKYDHIFVLDKTESLGTPVSSECCFYGNKKKIFRLNVTSITVGSLGTAYDPNSGGGGGKAVLNLYLHEHSIYMCDTT